MLHTDRESQDRIEEATEPIGRDPRVQVFHDEARAPRVEHLDKDGRSLGDLFSELTVETRTLVRQEIELAKTEVTASAKKAGLNAGFVAAGGALAYAGLIVLLFAVAYLLADWLESLGLATLIVAVATFIVSYVLVQKGLTGLKNTNFKPEHTIHTLQEDKQWLKEQI